MEQQPYVVYLTSSPKVIAIDPACQGDTFYRYKMKQVVVQTIGNGKMIKTSFTNLDDVAKELKVPPDYIPHYLGKAIGAQAKYDKKKAARERATISGEHSTAELSGLLVRFIREFVLCTKCKLPELDYTAKKSDIAMRCRSCGWKGNLSAIGVINEKFKRYAYTHPPPPPVAMRSAKGSTGSAENGSTSNGSTKPKGKDDKVVWLSDTSEKAMEERMESMVPDRLKELVAIDGTPEQVVVEKTPAEKLNDFIAAKPSRPSSEIIAEIQRLQIEHTLDKKAVTQLVFDVFLSDFDTIKDKIKPNKDVLIKFIGSQPLAQAVLLSSIEKKLDDMKDAKEKNEFISKRAVLAFKELYDEDVLEEETILQWFHPEEETETNQDPLRKVLEPFCKWLEEAQSESDEDDDDEDAEKVPDKVQEILKAEEEEQNELDEEIDAL